MAGKIFISYRREDDPGFAQLLYQELKQVCPTEDLFMDVKGHIQPGDDFRAVLTNSVAECDVLLAVIGPRWADLMVKRADDPDDFVKIEIGAALEQGKRVIPVLVGGAPMPQGGILPEPIRELATRHYIELRPDRFGADCIGFVGSLRPYLEAGRGARAALAEEERQKVENERQRLIAHENARRAALDEQKGRKFLVKMVIMTSFILVMPNILWIVFGKGSGIVTLIVAFVAFPFLFEAMRLGGVGREEERVAEARLRGAQIGVLGGLSTIFLGLIANSIVVAFLGVAAGLLLALERSRRY